jgi:hypothetical protein
MGKVRKALIPKLNQGLKSLRAPEGEVKSGLVSGRV